MRTTVAVVNEQGGDFVLDEVELEGPRSDEVLVRIVATGLCHTDLHLKGFLPAEMFPNVFGHEGAVQINGDFSGSGALTAYADGGQCQQHPVPTHGLLFGVHGRKRLVRKVIGSVGSNADLEDDAVALCLRHFLDGGACPIYAC